jgi:dTDP-4-amino-4,6-dideoxygalactose transaminase
MINVTKTFLPDRKLFDSYVDQIWKSAWLTNYGQLVTELELKLKDYFGVKHLFLVNNGTLAIQIAIKSLGSANGEIITTPFSYVATTSSVVWEGFKPVFVDIDPATLTMDASKIEAAITSKTRAILPVHVYGIPCNIEAIKKISKKYSIPVIYDAAHAFGSKYKERQLASYGDISTLSFHATKLFHTIEGGAILTNNDEYGHKISYMRNFGHETPTSFYGVGINAKMNEFCAAMGLSVIDSIPEIIAHRKKICHLYDALLLKNKHITRPMIPNDNEYNFSYYPVLFENESILLKITKALNTQQIFPRRYFYPSLNTLLYVKSSSCPVSEDISKRVLCLPLYDDLTRQVVGDISSIVLNAI